MKYRNQVEFLVHGRYALFTDPLTRIGGEKASYQVPTYQALKGLLESVYWKPTIRWIIDRVRVMNPIQTESKNVKPLKYGGGNDLSIYTYLRAPAYQVQAHFEWDTRRADLESDRNEHKHFLVAQRMIERGGRRDVFLGTRECQGYVEPCVFGEDRGHYDNQGELSFGLMFHGFEYPSDTGKNELIARFWMPKMIDGVIDFLPPEECTITKTIGRYQSEPVASVNLEEDRLLKSLLEEGDWA